MTSPVTVRLYDELFRGQHCLHASGDALGRKPKFVQWSRSGPPWPVSWFTDSSLREAVTLGDLAPYKVAWMLEPWELHPENYEYLVDHRHSFDAVVTHNASLASYLRGTGLYVLTAPSGGTRIAEESWRIWDKAADLPPSLIASNKATMPGHLIRAAVATEIKSVDLFGGIVGVPLEHKLNALSDRMFNVAVENTRALHWFTECLIDPLLAGTIPIYWGAPNLADYGFDLGGIVACESAVEVGYYSKNVSPLDYVRVHASGAIDRNFEVAKNYAMIEDWLYRKAPELFTGDRP